MKKILLFFLLSVLGISLLDAQNRAIEFTAQKDWKKIVRKAKKERKLIFVDCYTSWCGPCKKLAREVFTRDEVADYFNSHFVCAKFDMEKDAAGAELKKLFAVRAFPTLVFVDARTGDVVHRLVGAGDPAWLLKGAETALDPQNSLSMMEKRYAAGEREEGFLRRYLEALADAYMQKEQSQVACEYLNTLDNEKLATASSWELISKYVNDPLSRPLKQVMAHRKAFYRIAGRDAVDNKLSMAINENVQRLVAWKSDRPFDAAAYDAMVEYLLDIDFCGAAPALAYLYTSEFVRKKDFKGMLAKMREAMSYNLFPREEVWYYFQHFIEALALCTDKAVVEEGLVWIDDACGLTADPFRKAGFMDSKARIQKAIGDMEGAEKSRRLEEEYNKEGERKSGGNMIRAIRMG